MKTALCLLLLAASASAGEVSIRRRESGGGGEDRREERRGEGRSSQPAARPETRSEPVRSEPVRSQPAPAVSVPSVLSGRERVREQRPSGRVTIEPRRSEPRRAETRVELPRAAEFRRSVEIDRRADTAPRRVYWHDRGGVRYGHYYAGDTHWYGFNHGGGVYWARPYRGRWWWYDRSYARWVYWSSGYWWFTGPTGLFIYEGGEYYPYGTTVYSSPSPALPAPAPSASGSWMSPDGRRLVQVASPDAEAFLYDNTSQPPVFLRYLGRGATAARFYGGAAGQPLQILVEYAGRSAELFDANGAPVGAPAAPDAAPPAPSSDELPPPPGAAPGAP